MPAQYDSLATYSHLIGTWKWMNTGNDDECLDASQEVLFTVYSNGQFNIIENGQSVQGNWQVINMNTDSTRFTWGIKTNPTNPYFNNRIPSWCDKQMHLTGNYFEEWDGSWNIFDNIQ